MSEANRNEGAWPDGLDFGGEALPGKLFDAVSERAAGLELGLEDSGTEETSASHGMRPDSEHVVPNHSHMDTGFSGPVGAGQDVSERSYSRQADLRPVDSGRGDSLETRSRPKNAQFRERGSVGHSPITQALITMCMLACTLAAARFLVPTIIEEARYSWRRGQLRADYEASGDGLSMVGMDALSAAYQMVTQRVAPSVVHIEVIRTEDFGRSNFRTIAKGSEFDVPSRDQGSGVVVSEDGYVVTNHHVVSGGSLITVGLSDGRRVRAKVVGSDPPTDIALLKIEADGLTPIDWADSDDTEVGTPVWAVGSPFGLDRTVTFGILSGKHRAAKAGTSYQDFMQSDVAVNPGNSGGPLVDGRGRLVGINTAIVGETYRGVSFSIPSNVARRVFQRLRDTGTFERGWLGVELAKVPDGIIPTGLSPGHGAMVSRLVDSAAPAAIAGLATGDIIVAFEGDQVSDQGALMRMVGNWPAGQTAMLDVLRNGAHQAIAVEIGSRPVEYNLQ